MKQIFSILLLLSIETIAQPIYFNLNGSFVYVNSGVQSITTTGGTTTLTKLSVFLTIFNGTLPQTIVLPDATTLVPGNKYQIENSSTGLITVQTNGGATLWTIPAGADVHLTCSDVSAAAGQWEKNYRVGSVTMGKYQQFQNSLIFSGADGTTVNFPANTTISGTNSGDNAVNTLYSGLVTNANHTGDATGATALTLATVNGNVGSFGSATQAGTFTVNAKGLITAASNTTIAIPESAVTNLSSDLALKAPLASPAFTGTATGAALSFTGAITSSGGGIGYATGNGGTVTQATSKSTGVTLNKLAGDITMNGAALAAATIVSFTLTNSTIAATDIIHVQHQTTGTFGAYTINGRTAAGSAVISVRNNTVGSLSEAIIIKFIVLKSVTN